MRLYVLDADYIDEDGCSVIRLFCKDEKGHTVVCLDRGFRPYFYVLPMKGKAKSLKRKLESLQSVKIEKVESAERIVDGEKVKLLKVSCLMSSDVSKARDIVKVWKEDVQEEYEYSISFYRRYLIDNQIGGWIDVKGRKLGKKYRADSVIEVSEIKGVVSSKAPKLRLMSFKVEGGERIDAISVKSQGVEKVITGDERSVIEIFAKTVKDIDPDVMLGFGSDRFDSALLQKRAEELRIGLNMSRDGSKMKFSRRSFAPSASFRGVFHLDIYEFAANILKSQLQSELISLGSVSSDLLKDESMEAEYEGVLEAYRKKGDAQSLSKLALEEVRLIHNLGEFVLPQVLELSELCDQLPFDVSRMTYSQLVEWHLSKRAFSMGYVIPNQPKWDEIVSRRGRVAYAGGFVKEPLTGMHDDIIVMDFRSLYPSIIATFNISPETFNCPCCKKASLKVPEREYWFCKKRKGFVSAAIGELIERRARLKASMKKSKDAARLNNEQLAVKTVTNAMYGYFGFAQSKWYCMECADAAAAYGRFFMKKVIADAEKFGFTVVYGDTDSIFVTGKKDVKAFLEKVNRSLPGIVKLDLQGVYKRGLFIPKGDGAAKKRYALMDGSGALTVKGLEIVRRDWCRAAKKAQENVLRMIMEKDDAKGAIRHVRSVIADLRNGRIPLRDLVMIEQLSKPLEEYKISSPHVSAAKKMRERGRRVDEETPILFVIANGRGSISERAVPFEDATDADADYYIDHQIIPAAMRVLSAVGVKESDVRA